MSRKTGVDLAAITAAIRENFRKADWSRKDEPSDVGRKNRALFMYGLDHNVHKTMRDNTSGTKGMHNTDRLFGKKVSVGK